MNLQNTPHPLPLSLVRRGVALAGVRFLFEIHSYIQQRQILYHISHESN